MDSADMRLDPNKQVYREGEDYVLPLLGGTELVIKGTENAIDFASNLLAAVKNAGEAEELTAKLFNDLDNKNEDGLYFEVRE
jgi:hypothetical protein